jgi:translation initiation factor IF-2-like protein
MTVKDLADRIDVSVKDVLAKLLTKRLMMTINSPLDTETATMLSREFGADWGGASDPQAGGVREPRRHGPSGRLSAAALDEPDDGSPGINAVGSPALPAGEP